MQNTEALTMVKKRPITVEEYRKLKQRDLILRCQYVKLIQNQKRSKNPEYSKRIRKLEKRLAKLELRLAYSEIILPEPEPMRIVDYLAIAWRSVKRFWRAATQAPTVKKLTARYLH